VPVYSRGALGAIIVFDVGRRESFSNIPMWLKYFSVCDPRLVIAIVANKIDIEPREIAFQEGDAFSHEGHYLYVETSAKTGAGVDEAFGLLAECVLNLRTTKGLEEKKRAENSGGWCERYDIQMKS
jgi:Ras-related protein Rab-2A